MFGYSQTQDIIMPKHNNVPGFEVVYVTCDANFYDSGGINEPFEWQENGIITFCPINETDRSQIFFSHIDLISRSYIRVYDGDSENAPLLKDFSNVANDDNGYTIIASQQNPTGCLTVTFNINWEFDFDYNYPPPYDGWEAKVSCIDPCQDITTSVQTDPESSNNILRACPGEDITFFGTAIFSESDNDASYEWDFGDGSELQSGLSVTHNYPNPGTYLVNFTATDYMGCKDRSYPELIVQISPEPSIDLSVIGDNPICLGKTTTLTANLTANSEGYAINYPSVVNDLIQIPYGTPTNSGAKSCVNLEFFADDATINSVDDIKSIVVNMEHPALNELELRLIAPNGATIDLIAYPSESDFDLGEPLYDAKYNPGIGYNYTFEENATQTLNSYAIGGGVDPIPEGTYKPSESFANLIGTPINGKWCIEVLEHEEYNNGYIFNWKLNFDDKFSLPQFSFEPQIVSQQWLDDTGILSVDGNSVIVKPQNYGENCYTYEAVDDAGCVFIKSICVDVYDEMPLVTPSSIVKCGNGTAIFDLTIRESQLLNALNANDYSISYHNSLIDAETVSNPITNVTNYVSNQDSEIIYIAVKNKSTSCIQVVELELSTQGPLINISNTVEICNLSNSVTFTADLTQFNSTILGNQSSNEFNVSYFTSQSDAEANINNISNPDSYQTHSNPELIYVRVTSSSDSSCFSVGYFEMNTLPFPDLGTPNNLYTCDDITNDGIEVFNFDAQINQIIGDLDTNSFSVTFYNSLIDAEQHQNTIGSSYTNINASETIFTRVEKIINPECYKILSFTVNVLPNLVLGTPNNLYVNDDVSGDEIEEFDLTANNTLLLDGLPPNDYTISFYNSFVDAEAGSNALSNPYLNKTNPETIYVRVKSVYADCFEISSFELYINTIPETITVSDYTICDDDTDGLTTFSLINKTEEISNNQANVNVQFFETITDRDANSNALNTSSYTNILNPQTIYYRLTDTITGAFAYGEFTIEAILPPEITSFVELNFCDPGSGSIDLNLNDYSNQFTQNADYTTNYFQTEQEAKDNVNNLNYIYSLTESTLLYVRVENQATGCYVIGNLQLWFNGVDKSTLLPNYSICIDSNGNIINESAVLDSGLSEKEYTFRWYFENTQLENETNAILTTEQAGNYSVEIENIQNGCQTTLSTIVNYSSVPDSYDVSLQSNVFASNNIIQVTATGLGKYLFSIDGGLFDDVGIFSNVSAGLHNVSILEKNGCGFVEVPIYVVGYPKFFTPNNDGFNDTWHIQGKEAIQIIKLYIFNRFGKLLKELTPNSIGWDGTFNNRPLPSSDYWFSMEFKYQGETKRISGHFTLIR